MIALSLAAAAVTGERWWEALHSFQSGSWIGPYTAVYLHDVVVITPYGNVFPGLALLFIGLWIAATAAIPIVIAWRGSFSTVLTLTVLMWLLWLYVLVLWPIFLNAPLEEPSNPYTIPPPSYSRFPSVRDLWSMASPWLLGVAVPLQGFTLTLHITVVWVIYLAKAGAPRSPEHRRT